MSTKVENLAPTPPDQSPILSVDDLDNLGRAVLTLVTELWAVKDRQRVTEAVLAQRGIDIKDAIDTHVPDPELAALLAEERDALLNKIVADLTGSGGR